MHLLEIDGVQEYVMQIEACLEKADRSAGLDCPHTRKLKVLPSTVLSTEPAGPSALVLVADVDAKLLLPSATVLQ